MKRIVVLIDGTWGREGTGRDTNVAKLDSGIKIATRAFIKAKATDGTVQNVHYHDGVGAEGDLFRRLLGGAIGLGLKKIIQEAYGFVVSDHNAGDEVYIFGFSRGAYAARALAGLIGASGIQRARNAQQFEVAWNHYRVTPSARRQPLGITWRSNIVTRWVTDSAALGSSKPTAPDIPDGRQDFRTSICRGLFAERSMTNEPVAS